MAIFTCQHRHVGKSTQAQPGTAAAHVRYITRRTAAELVMGEHMPTAANAAQSWMEAAELGDRKNGRVIDKLTLALPVELDAAAHADMVRDFALEIGGGRVAWLAAFHGQGTHNPHAHLILRDKDIDSGKRVFGTTEKGSTERLRELWELVQNRHLEAAGLDVRVSRLSLAEQGLERTPGIHVGPNVAAMEDRGIRPASMAQELENGRVINWPEIDKGRTRADRQREIEAENLERDRQREKEKGGDLGTPAPSMEATPELAPEMGGAEVAAPMPEATPAPSYEAENEPPPDFEARFGPTTPEPSYVPNFVLVTPELDFGPIPEDRFGPSPEIDPHAGMVIDMEPDPEPEIRAPRPTPDPQPEPEAVPEPELELRPRSSMDYEARRAMEELARTDPLGMAARHGFHAGDRLKSPEDMRREWAERMRSLADPVPEPELELRPWQRMTAEKAPEKVQEPSLGLAGASVAPPEPEAPQRSRLADFVALARDRLAELANRLDAAFAAVLDRQRDKVADAPERRPAAAEIETPRPTPANPLDAFAELGRKQPRKREPEPEQDRSIWDDFMRGPRSRGPGGPGL